MVGILVPLQDPSPKAARSVHLWWTAPTAMAFYQELAVEKSTPGSYFMACGWNCGYFGIQELKKDEKIVLFSVWDPTKGNNPKVVPADQQVEVVKSDPDAKIGRFGGEGTGAQCKYTYSWKTGEICRFLVSARVEESKTSFTGWFWRNDVKTWKAMATFRVRTGGSLLKGFYSFVEDFRRDGKSPGEGRIATLGNGWIRTPSGEWSAIVRARFTADSTPLLSIDARVSGESFTLATGGETQNTTKLNSELALPEGKRSPPADLPAEFQKS